MQLNNIDEDMNEVNIKLLVQSLKEKGQTQFAQTLIDLVSGGHHSLAFQITKLISLKNKDLSLFITDLETLLLVAIENKISQHARSKTENSMITDADNRAGLLERVLPHYLPLLEQKGNKNLMKGVDTVLKEFEDILVEKIDLLTKVPGTGEKSRLNFSERREISEELGKYHTVLRLLLDKSNVVRYQSLFHLGSTATFDINSKDYSYRLLLALYYLAATDRQMQFSLKWIEMNIELLIDTTKFDELGKIKDDEEKLAKFCEEVRSSLAPQSRQVLLEKSLEHFIRVIAEDIRRAHNGDPGFPTEEDKLDAPSCQPGTINKLLGSCISNDLVYVPVPSARRLVELIDEYVITVLEAQQNTTLRKALYECLDYLIMGADASFDSTVLYSQFIVDLTQEKQLQSIYEYLKHSSLKFDINHLPNELQRDVKLCIAKIVQVKQGEFLFLPEFGRVGFFAAKLLSIGAKTRAKQDLYSRLHYEVVPVINDLQVLTYSLTIVQQLINNEYTKLILSSKYFNSKDANFQVDSLKLLFKDYILKKDALITKFGLIFNTAVEKLKTEYKKNYEQKLLENLKKASSEIEKDFETELNQFRSSEEQIEGFLFHIQHLDKLVDTAKLKISWANAIFELAKRSCDTHFDEDLQALQSLIHLMLSELNTIECQSQLKTLEAQILSEKSVEMARLLENIFVKEKQFSEQPLKFLGISNVKSQIMKTVSLEEIIKQATTMFEDNFLMLDKIARTQLFRITLSTEGIPIVWLENDNSDEAYAYMQWKQTVLELLQNSTSNNLQGLYSFILLTFYHNLCLDETFQINIDMLQEITEFFLAKNPANTPTQTYLQIVKLPYKSKNPDINDQECVASLGSYLSCLLTRLKFVPNGIKSGAIIIASHEVAKLMLLSDQDKYIDSVKKYYLEKLKIDKSTVDKYDFSKKRIVVRTALSEPNGLAVSYFNFWKTDQVNKAIAKTHNAVSIVVEIGNIKYQFILADETVLFHELNHKKDFICDEEKADISYLVPAGLPVSAFDNLSFQLEMQNKRSLRYIKMREQPVLQSTFRGKTSSYIHNSDKDFIKEDDKKRLAINGVEAQLKKVKLSKEAEVALGRESFFATEKPTESKKSDKEEESKQEETSVSAMNL